MCWVFLIFIRFLSRNLYIYNKSQGALHYYLPMTFSCGVPMRLIHTTLLFFWREPFSIVGQTLLERIASWLHRHHLDLSKSFLSGPSIDGLAVFVVSLAEPLLPRPSVVLLGLLLVRVPAGPLSFAVPFCTFDFEPFCPDPPLVVNFSFFPLDLPAALCKWRETPGG